MDRLLKVVNLVFAAATYFILGTMIFIIFIGIILLGIEFTRDTASEPNRECVEVKSGNTLICTREETENE